MVVKGNILFVPLWGRIIVLLSWQRYNDIVYRLSIINTKLTSDLRGHVLRMRWENILSTGPFSLNEWLLETSGAVYCNRLPTVVDVASLMQNHSMQ